MADSPRRRLPAQPSLEHLSKQAKRLLVTIRQQSPKAKLTQAQLQLAREYGFSSWRAMKTGVEARRVVTPPPSPAPASAKPVRKVTPADWKPLMDAAFAGDVVKVRRLLAAGADPNVLSTTNHRHRPLHRAIEHKKTMPKTPGHEQVVEALLQAGADPMLQATQEHVTALAMAAMNEVRFVPILLRYMKVADLFHACVLADLNTVRAMLARDCSLARATDEHGWTPLHYCAFSAMFKAGPKQADAQLAIARLLLSHGADPQATFLYGKRWPIPVLYGCCGRHDHPAMAELLMQAGANPCDGESVYHAAEQNHQGVLAVIERHADRAQLADECSMSLRNQLHWGITQGMPWLLAHGADPNAPSPDTGDTALHKAAHNGASEKVIALLLTHGADPAIRNASGQRPVDVAQAAGRARVVAQLNAWKK